MKKIAVAMAMFMAAGAASAANSHQQGKFAMGFNALGSSTVAQDVGGVDVSDVENMMITGKYMLSNNMALTGGVGFVNRGNDADGTDFAFRVGVRNYLRADDFSPFVGGHFGYASLNDGDLNALEFAAEFGAEYFLAQQFSVEGTAVFGYATVDDDAANADYSFLGTARGAVGFNFYF